MRDRILRSIVFVTLFCVLGHAQGQTPASPGPAGTAPAAATSTGSASSGMPAHLAGRWTSPPERTTLSSAFEESVWGKGAVSERLVELRIESSGDATLVVTNRILDADGNAFRGPTSIETSRLQIGGPTGTSGIGTDHAVTVVSAERRYPDDPPGQWALERLKVRVITRDPGDNRVEIRYDTPEGRGSFWKTLTREGSAARAT